VMKVHEKKSCLPNIGLTQKGPKSSFFLLYIFFDWGWGCKYENL